MANPSISLIRDKIVKSRSLTSAEKLYLDTLLVDLIINGVSLTLGGIVTALGYTPADADSVADMVSDISEAPAYTAEYQAVYDKATDLAYAKPTDDESIVLNLFIRNLKSTNNFFTRMETGNVYGRGSIEFGTLNLKDPDTFQHTSPDLSSITFGNGGIKSNLTASSYINTQYAVNQRVGIESAFTVIVYISESSVEEDSNKVVFGSRGQSGSSAIQRKIIPKTTAIVGARQGYATSDNFNSANHKGLYILVGNGTQVILYKDYDGESGLKDTQTVVPSAPNISNKEFLLATNNSTSSGLTPLSFYDKDTLCLFRFIDAFSDADAIAFKTVFDDFRIRLGL